MITEFLKVPWSAEQMNGHKLVTGQHHGLLVVLGCANDRVALAIRFVENNVVTLLNLTQTDADMMVRNSLENFVLLNAQERFAW